MNRISLVRLIAGDPEPAWWVSPDGRILECNQGAQSLQRLLDLEGASLQSLEAGQVLSFESGRSFEVYRIELMAEGGLAHLIRLKEVTHKATIRELQSRLLHSERLAAMGQLAAGVAHEVNNPAAFVSANLSLVQELLDSCLRGLQEGKELLEMQDWLQECIEVTRENMQGMSRISAVVRDLRRFSRIEKETLEYVHVNEAVNAACNLVHNQIRHKARLVKELDHVPRIAADRHKLTQVLTNLLMNAAQAIPEGETGHTVQIRTEARQEEVHVVVSDSGIGIPSELQERIFDPFFTTKPQEHGTGLGLSLCADIVRQHGGRIEVKSRLSCGSQFRVVLPSAGEGPAQSSDPSEPVQAVPTVRGRVLLIDDEPLLLKAYQRALARKHQVVVAQGGPAALEILTQDGGFDAVVCDLMMPDIDGVEVHRWAKVHRPELVHRFIFCSGGAFTPRTGSFCENVDLPVLEKPVANRLLEQTIQKTMASHLSPENSSAQTLDLERVI